MRPLSGLVIAAAIAFGGLAASSAAAENIVVNGGFEDSPMVGSTPIGYTQSGNLSDTGISIGAAHTGDAAYDFGGSQSGGLGFLSQDLTTVAGQQYELSYYLDIPGDPPTADGPAEFLVNVGGDASSGTLVGGDTLSDMIDPLGNGQPFPASYALFTNTFTATSTQTELNFGAYNNPSFFLLDDISVSATPEPSTWALMIAGVAMAGATLRRRRALSPA